MIAQDSPVVTAKSLTLEQRRIFLKLSLEERRRQMTAQAEQIAEHYEQAQEMEERLQWQGGDIVEL